MDQSAMYALVNIIASDVVKQYCMWEAMWKA